MRNKILNLPTTRQSQVLISAATADIANDQIDEPQNEPTTTTATTTVQERNKKEYACGNKLIVHYTHEKRFQTFKSDMHQVYDNIFKDTPAADVKLIVGNKNRRLAKTELICKRPKQSLLINKPFKRSSQSNLQIVEENVKNQQVNNDSTNSLIDDKNLMAQDDFDKIVSSFSMSNEIESMDLFDENLNFTDGNVIRLSIFSCLKSHTLLVDLPLDNNPGQKRPLESDLNSNEHSKRSCSLNDLILTDIIELKEKVSELETRITKIEDGLMCKHKFLFLTCLRIIYCVLLWKVH
ncbi:unnamed protein product [Rotaria magnacalcarata]|uniref:Uncharacterized protein n=2 Tax=Rotaria magnacalcarata TaxID=392030 RepID=A0A815VGR7_9BILA|nr:unnamed protein product [Rotaria magnacalcarata]